MKLRAFITIDEKPLCSVYEVWVYDLTDPDHPRKLPDRLGTYPSQFYAERARRNFDVHRLEIELEQEYA
jgi:hypothetical protein